MIIGIGAAIVVASHVSREVPLLSLTIVPCRSSIDAVDFDRRDDLAFFLERALPYGSDPDCARRVLIGRKMRASGFYDRAGTIAFYGEHFTLQYWRAWNVINLGYNTRGVTLTYKGGKLVKRVLI